MKNRRCSAFKANSLTNNFAGYVKTVEVTGPGSIEHTYFKFTGFYALDFKAYMHSGGAGGKIYRVHYA